MFYGGFLSFDWLPYRMARCGYKTLGVKARRGGNINLRIRENIAQSGNSPTLKL